ncbi:hypothetical protein N7457_007179 [Penicillium paradoxum]|uniref:uncharacterized protein n=1 Tax=Penicillium paradoxum TaxID=176176 RepID=UPI002548E944|nr:uncharacterized protein N7457_007179 [Penicillium paradoxum]KAJ5779459.1 hypothetical protein N7457_007179 [Penicillium paradoxum]
METLLSSCRPSGESSFEELFASCLGDWERSAPTLSSEERTCLPTYETIRFDGHKPMDHGNAGLDFDKAFAELDPKDDPVLGLDTLGNLEDLALEQLYPQPLTPIVTYDTPPSSCMSQSDTVTLTDISNFSEDTVPLTDISNFSEDTVPLNDISNFSEDTDSGSALETDTATFATSAPLNQDAPLSSTSVFQGNADTSLISASVSRMNKGPSHISALNNQATPVDQVALIAQLGPHTGLNLNHVSAFNQANFGTAAAVVQNAPIAHTPYTGIDMNLVSAFNQANLVIPAPVAQAAPASFVHPATGTHISQTDSGTSGFLPGPAKLFTMETAKRPPKQKSKRIPQNKQVDELHGDEKRKITLTTPRKAKAKKNQAPITPLQKIASVTPMTPVKGVVGTVIPQTPAPPKTPAPLMTPMTRGNEQTVSKAPIAYSNPQQRLQIRERQLRFEWQLLQAQRAHLEQQQPPSDAQQLQIYERQTQLHNDQLNICKQKIMHHREQMRGFMYRQQNLQHFQAAAAQRPAYQMPAVYPTPPKERVQPTLYQPQQVAFSAPAMGHAQSGSSLSSASSSASSGKRKFEFVENVVPPNFVANPNNHARWDVGPAGERIYLNGRQAKKARIAQK